MSVTDDHRRDGTGSGERRERARRSEHRRQVAHNSGSLTWRHMLEDEFDMAMAQRDPWSLYQGLREIASVAADWMAALERRGGLITESEDAAGGSFRELVAQWHNPVLAAHARLAESNREGVDLEEVT